MAVSDRRCAVLGANWAREQPLFDLVLNRMKTLACRSRIMTPISSRITMPKISKPAMPISTESADT
jgi:hypothetical protein